MFVSIATIASLLACTAHEPLVTELDTGAAATERVETTSTPTASELPFSWPVPEGWRTETIPFPLGFAPTLLYVGVEELRFAPDMFTAGSDEYWTYAFVWWLQDEIEFDAATLNNDLAAYYLGLSLAVEQREDFDPKDADAIAKLSPAQSAEVGTARFAGPVSAYDPFVLHTRVELNVDVRVFRCAAQNRTVALFTVSPQPREHAVWTRLAALSDAFRCSQTGGAVR